MALNPSFHRAERIYPAARSSGSRLHERLCASRKFTVFDDSFSALDFKTDAKLRAALLAETADAAMLIVAQRVSTIMQRIELSCLTMEKSLAIGNAS